MFVTISSYFRMAVPCIILLGRFIVDSLGESMVTSPRVSECCAEKLDLNGSCPTGRRCSPGCYRLLADDGRSTCVPCSNETSLSVEITYNVTECRNMSSRTIDLHMNTSTPSVAHNLGSPGVAASLLLGILLISLFLILSVASFFYLKRSQKLPEMFYRRNKASILQPSELASMIPDPRSSVRKPRYVRRERRPTTTNPVLLNPPEDTTVSNV
ncbi:uncharacterized protein C1orf159 homolog [Spea bombifrons]|uniref:uncharacterized protein C1orf159 homolog n=1 Tax=Spea bombifrons TaxID=233779 RepID=UPI0023495CD0|nr:uncharacterized protein C1orf159 homolog [Spea bombifrons]